MMAGKNFPCGLSSIKHAHCTAPRLNMVRMCDKHWRETRSSSTFPVPSFQSVWTWSGWVINLQVWLGISERIAWACSPRFIWLPSPHPVYNTPWSTSFSHLEIWIARGKALCRERDFPRTNSNFIFLVSQCTVDLWPLNKRGFPRTIKEVYLLSDFRWKCSSFLTIIL